METQKQELENDKQQLENRRQELEQAIANQEQEEARSRYKAIRDQADRITQRIDDLRDELLTADENQMESIKGKIRQELADLARLEDWAEQAQEWIPLKERVKEIFKKHGFTMVAVLTGVGAVIGTIASFIFRTAGEILGFLGRNAWLLIVAAVIFVIEKFKEKRS